MSQPAPVPILMYHSIATHASPSFRPFVLEPALFDEHLDYLAEHRYTTLTARECARLWSLGEPLPPRPVVLTFDDAYGDFYDAALPALVARSMCATLFVPTAYVGGRARWLADCAEEDRPILSWDALQEVASAGVEVGAHSHTHPQMDLISPAAAREEINTSRVMIEDALGMAVGGFAYPYGYWNRGVRRAVRDAGLGYACQVSEATGSVSSDPFALPRQTIRGGAGVVDLQRVLQDRPLRVDRAVGGLKRVAWRVSRRVRVSGGDSNAPGAA